MNCWEAYEHLLRVHVLRENENRKRTPRLDLVATYSQQIAEAEAALRAFAASHPGPGENVAQVGRVVAERLTSEVCSAVHTVAEQLKAAIRDTESHHPATREESNRIAVNDAMRALAGEHLAAELRALHHALALGDVRNAIGMLLQPQWIRTASTIYLRARLKDQATGEPEPEPPTAA